jgi:hypothetical protein
MRNMDFLLLDCRVASAPRNDEQIIDYYQLFLYFPKGLKLKIFYT